MDRLITEETYSAFAERGYVWLPGFLPPESAEPAIERVQRVLARAAPSDSLTAVRKRLKPLAKLPEFSALLTSGVRQCARELAGGGGTAVIAGSHRLLNDQGRIRSKDVKRRLSKEAYFQDLFNGALPDRERFVDEIGHVEDVALQVVKFTGEPGDVYFSDLRVLHSLAPNARSAPRLCSPSASSRQKRLARSTLAKPDLAMLRDKDQNPDYSLPSVNGFAASCAH